MTRIGTSDLDVFPICLGGNVFGWTADRDESFRILNSFVDAGGDFIDTADAYSAWIPGNSGGESETLIGEWLAARKPANVTIATKVSQHPDFPGLSATNVRAAAEASLKRLGVETIDLYFAHFDDENTPLEETVAAFGALVADGLVRYTAVSNYSASRIEEWISLARRVGVAEPVAVQPHYNLVERGIENDIIPLAKEQNLGVVPYFSLAKGFLTGKYTADGSADSSPRAQGARAYATEKNLALMDGLRTIADDHGTSMAAVSLAWLRTRPAVVAPIASASKTSQLPDLIASATLRLADDELDKIEELSAPADSSS